MNINFKEKWQQLRRRARRIWAKPAEDEFPQTETGRHRLFPVEQPATSLVDMPRIVKNYSPKPFRDREKADVESTDSGAAAGQYRSTPDPAFGSRSAAQRRAYENEQRAKEEEAAQWASGHRRQHGDVAAGQALITTGAHKQLAPARK